MSPASNLDSEIGNSDGGDYIIVLRPSGGCRDKDRRRFLPDLLEIIISVVRVLDSFVRFLRSNQQIVCRGREEEETQKGEKI
jgi:hypothetical protein